MAGVEILVALGLLLALLALLAGLIAASVPEPGVRQLRAVTAIALGAHDVPLSGRARLARGLVHDHLVFDGDQGARVDVTLYHANGRSALADGGQVELRVLRFKDGIGWIVHLRRDDQLEGFAGFEAVASRPHTS